MGRFRVLRSCWIFVDTLLLTGTPSAVSIRLDLLDPLCMPLTIPEGGRSIFAGRIEDDDDEEVVVVTSGGAEKFSIRVLANTSARDPLVPLTSPWDSVEDADEEVDDP